MMLTSRLLYMGDIIGVWCGVWQQPKVLLTTCDVVMTFLDFCLSAKIIFSRLMAPCRAGLA
jgi:hypothetical protein